MAQSNHHPTSKDKLSKSFYRHNKASMIVTMILGIYVAAYNLYLSYSMMEILDSAVAGDRVALTSTLYMMLIGLAIYVIVGLVRRETLAAFMRKAMFQYKEAVFEKIMRKNISTFARESTSKYISALTNDVTSLETNYLVRTLGLVVQVLMFAGALVMMLKTSPWLTLVAILFAAIPIAGSIISGGGLAKAETSVSNQNESFVSGLKDLLVGFPIIKSYQIEKPAVEQFTRMNEELESAKYRRRKAERLLDLVGDYAGIIAQFGIFLFGAFLTTRSESVTVGVLLMFTQLMNYLMQPVAEIPPILANRKAAGALMDKLDRALEESLDSGERTVQLQEHCDINIRNLSFAYPEGEAVLKSVNIRFEKGKSYAIVGGSGSGKTTLLNLLMGGYEGYQGEISYGSHGLRNINLSSLYSKIALVQQSVFVFNSTLGNNITLFREMDNRRLEDAINKSGLKKLVETNGLDYLCGDNGANLSGGERQRLSIARCFIQQPTIMLMDEATAALDAELAHSIIEAVLSAEDTMRIVVTHRLDQGQLSRFDEIIVMKHGQIAEQGSFEELYRKKGYFYSLYTVSAEG